MDQPPLPPADPSAVLPSGVRIAIAILSVVILAGGLFAASRWYGLWPAQTASPTPAPLPTPTPGTPFSWNSIQFTVPPGWAVAPTTYRTPAQQEEGAAAEVVGFTVTKTTERGADVAAEWTITAGGPQSAGTTCADVPAARCTIIPYRESQPRFPMYTASSKPETLHVFENIVAQLQESSPYDSFGIQYSHANYGFSLLYSPPIRTYDPATDTSYIPGCDASARGGNAPLLCLTYKPAQYDGTNFTTSYVTVQTALCTAEVQGEFLKTDTIGRTTFRVYGTGSAGAGHSAIGKLWRGPLSGNTCLDIAYEIQQTAFGNYPAGSIKEFTADDFDAVATTLLQVPLSFRPTLIR